MRTTCPRSVLAALAAATAAGALATTAAAVGAPAATTAGGERAAARTTVTFEVAGCEGCTVALAQGRWDDSAPTGVRIWQTRSKQVRDGEVRFTVPTRRTRGMSATLRAPWEEHTGYVTAVAFRYAGARPGDPVSFAEARAEQRATACWAGTDARSVTVPLTVREVEVDGVHGAARGTIAYASTTQRWLQPMRQVVDGVLGSQDAHVCGRR